MNKQFIITNFAAFALMLFLPTGCRQADGKQDAVQSYRVIKVAASPVEISESYSAAIRGRQDVDILPQISGRIIRLKVKEGERVKTGQVLAVIDQVPIGRHYARRRPMSARHRQKWKRQESSCGASRHCLTRRSYPTTSFLSPGTNWQWRVLNSNRQRHKNRMHATISPIRKSKARATE